LIEVAKKSIAQMVQRALVGGVPTEFGEKAELPEVSDGPSGLVECAEEKLPKLFIERSLSSRVDYWRAIYIVQISLTAKLVPLLKPVSLSRQPVGKLRSGLACFILVDAMLRHQTSKKGAMGPTRYIMSRGNREKRTVIVIEANSVVKAGNLYCVFVHQAPPFDLYIQTYQDVTGCQIVCFAVSCPVKQTALVGGGVNDSGITGSRA
jgi:hypothetical protein